MEAEPGVDSDSTKPVDTVKLLLQLEDPKKRKDKHKENEGIQFDFNLGTDQAEKVTLELVSNWFFFLAPKQFNQTLQCMFFVSQLRQVGAITVMCTQAKLKISIHLIFNTIVILALNFTFSVLPSACCSTLMLINL